VTATAIPCGRSARELNAAGDGDQACFFLELA
jgi:hypothetical protein